MGQLLGVTEAVPFYLGGGTQGGLIIAFLVAAAIIVGSGLTLSKYGDALGDRTGLGAGLIGLIFLAGVTSLPELVVSTSSTLQASLEASRLALGKLDPRYAETLRGGADLAIGNMIGSNVFNLMILALIDLVQGKGALMFRLHRNHILSAAMGMGMLGILLFGLSLAWQGQTLIPGLETGPVTPFLFIAYIVVMKLTANHERKDAGSHALVLDESEYEEAATDTAKSAASETEDDNPLLTMSAPRFYGMIAFCALLIVVCGIWLSQIGDRMALPTGQGGLGLGQSVVGTIFLAISTSLPEVVVSFGAARMGAFDMAVGNVLGSNVFNLAILFPADIGLRGGSLLHYASPTHLVAAAMVLMLSAVAVCSLMIRTKKSFARIGFDVWVMVLIYVVGNIAMVWLGVS